ncbi:hypothetical protein [Stakelama saccharophila]|uniref:Uncharacterized protein n=1 Tax=Stakelama saccharophila TaxID=3075605 RepID=A0ABZ0B777_9SPHN|nr:hypothetical protein [Stakelama sp. W311]WNO52718.1 hypothetical protein RPR59_09600 [Stakelama sp. W311]
MRAWTIGAVALAAALLALLIDPVAVAAGWRAGFLTAGAPVLGAVLMLMIGRVVGADWRPFGVIAAATPIILLAGLPILPAQFASNVPSHLSVWGSPWFIAGRTIAAIGALAFVGLCLVRGASLTFAAVSLALYAVLVSIVAYDWLLGGSLGHPISSIGMILTAEQIGGACAGLLILGLGDSGLRRDMSYMLIAMGLALSYLIFMDYLIKWYADLPSQVDWYLERDNAMSAMAGAALLLGLFGPIISLTLSNGEAGRRVAALCSLLALALINLWFVSGAWLAALVQALVITWMAAWSLALARRRNLQEAHG